MVHSCWNGSLGLGIRARFTMMAHNDPSIKSNDAPPSSSTAISPPAQTPSNGSTYLSSLLASTLVITIQDGRSFVGLFICTDRDQNIILNQAEEFLPPRLRRTPDNKYQEPEERMPVSVGAWGGREVGMIMFRAKDIVKIEAQLPLELQARE
ncbi:hypothetical protein QFC24_002176 [Naganishia onofrii]|uniref:Uncharacterized protein n=1 Tax=Naganishia onofrii TaxID=1851511 RepID=A0ACC2XRE7_9TREE|nr:hypothetical protein QFC24_002176 [Naganishia onofrii]